MRGVAVEVVGSRVVLDFSGTDLCVETLTERTHEILPLLYALMLADSCWLKLSDDELDTRGRGCAAINMMCQQATINATKMADLLRAIADGSETIADHGFPEFGGVSALDV